MLRILLLHLANGCSLAETAARAQVAGLGSISAVGVFKRLRAAGPWLRWLAQQERGQQLCHWVLWAGGYAPSMLRRFANRAVREEIGGCTMQLTSAICNATFFN